ncbi:hypothetical protein LPJ73_002639 [Coemansia sp. RSA 2703]|nr:hypothetical protein LPJ73_002639 [Coemansia sp. RSA 2703]
MSTTLAIGYMRQIHQTFVLSDEVEKQMVDKIIVNFVISIIPLVGWILRRIYSVNKRNYRVLEEYILATASRQEEPQTSSNKKSTKTKLRK